MPLYINDYLSDTLHLSAEESGAYLFLIMHYWKKGNISGDIEQISRISRCATSITQAILSEFFEYANGSWKHGRIDIELKKAQDNKEMRAIRAKKAADARWSKDATSKPQAMLNECPSPTPSSSPISTQEPTKKDSVPKRRTRFVKPTVFEVSSYCSERKNGVDPQRFIDHYESNGWMVGKTKMKDWKAAVRNWEKNSYNRAIKPDSYNTEMNFEL